MSHDHGERAGARRSQEDQRALAANEPAVAPGKRPRTASLPQQTPAAARPATGAMVQQAPDPAAEAARREQAARTAQWLDTAARPDLHPPPRQSAQSQAVEIDSPRPGIDKPGFIDNSDGANIRTGPAELGGEVLTAQPLPPATRVFVSGQHPQTADWWYVSAFLPSAIVRGYVQHFRITTDLPEPGARLYQIQPGDTVERLAVQEFAAAVRPGHDLRYYENVLLAVNREHNRAGIQGSFQDPGLLGGGSDNIQLEAGRRIWLVSPAYARALEGSVPDGSLTNGLHAQARHALGHIEDLVQSVTNAPLHVGAVAGDYAAAIQEHLPEIVGITAGFILAESASAFLAATPTGVGQLAAVFIQLGLAAFGAGFALEAAGQALAHGEQWLTLAWTAHHDPAQLAAASKAFVHMLVSLAMAALTIAGVHGNLGKGLKVADAIHIQPPGLGMSPALATANGGITAGGPVFTPGSIATTGPVDIGISRMTAIGAGGSKANQEGSAGPELKWDNPKSKPTYGHTFIEHTQKAKPKSLADRARNLGHQVGQWLDDTAAAAFIAKVAREKGPGTWDVPLPGNLAGRSFLGDLTELPADMARIVVKPNGAVRTAFPYNAAYPH